MNSDGCCSSPQHYICIAIIYGLFCRDVTEDCQHLAFCNSAWRLLQTLVWFCQDWCWSVRVCVDGEGIMKNWRHERHFLATCSCPLNEYVFLALTNHFSFCTEFPLFVLCTFCRTQRFIALFTSARHLSLTSARGIYSKLLHPTFWISILILSFHLLLLLPACLFSSGPHQNPVFILSPTYALQVLPI